MRRLALLLVAALALTAGCGSEDERRPSIAPRLATVASTVHTSTTATAITTRYEPITMPFASRAWLNRVDGALVVESCQEVEAYVAQGHTLRELVDYRSYSCGPTVTSMVVAGGRGVADLFSRR